MNTLNNKKTLWVSLKKIKSYQPGRRVKEELELTTTFLREEDKKGKILIGRTAVTLPLVIGAAAGLGFSAWWLYKVDIDEDGISDFDEIFKYHTNSFRPNPVTAYAVEKNIPPEMLGKLKVLEQDEKMDENEKTFVDVLSYVNSDLIPKDVRVYYTKEEILSLQQKLIASIVEDEKVSDSETKALEKLLYNERWYITKDVIDSGMVNEKHLMEDWDEDGLSNITEIVQGTNPLNELEVSLDNPSERYAILVNSMGGLGDAKINLEIYHLFRKNGYDDNNIILFWSLMKKLESDYYKYTSNFPLYKWLEPSVLRNVDEYVKIDFKGYDEIEPENFLNAIKNLPSDNNDKIFIYYIGHGPGPLGDEGLISPEDMNKALASIKYGRLVFLNETCSSETFTKQLNYPYQLHEALIIVTSSEGQSIGNHFSKAFFRKLDEGVSIKETFEYARDEVSKRISYSLDPQGRLITFFQKSLVYYFDPQNKECSWWESFSIIKYLPKKQ